MEEQIWKFEENERNCKYDQEKSKKIILTSRQFQTIEKILRELVKIS